MMNISKPTLGVKLLLGSLIFLLVLSPTAAAFAMGGGGSPKPAATSGQKNPDYLAGKQAAKAKDWPKAIRSLEKATKSYPQNADAWNYLGYSYRKSGNLAKAFPAYEQALKIDPKHRGALEYLGEAYLQAGNLPKAQVQLDRLVKICGQNCEESKDLKKAIATYKAAKSTPGSQ
jgi:cytochrome c-type biogenesis protein CcmH/NrfG